MRKRSILFSLILVLLFSFDISFANDLEMVEKYKFLTLLPPIVAIILAFITKNVVFSLFVGVLSGTFLVRFYSENFFMAFVNGFLDVILNTLNSLADKWNAGIILQCLAIGGLIALISKMGGALAVANALSKKAKTLRSTQLITWVLGLFVFFDDYANSLIVGPIMRPISDKMKLSREKLAFIVDGTAAPIAGIAMVSTWVGYEVGLIKDAYSSIGMEVNSYSIFLESIPFRFYNILVLAFIVISAITLREFGPMLKSQRRAYFTGEVKPNNKNIQMNEENNLKPKEGIKLRVCNALVPIAVLIITSFIGFYLNGYSALLENVDVITKIQESPLSFYAIRETFGASDASIVLFQSAIIASLVALIMGISQKIFTLSEGIEIFVEGMKELVITGVILLLAWSLSSVIKELGTAKFLVSILSSKIPAFLLPSIIFILASIISFATGTAYGTMGILMPLAIPLANSIGSANTNFILAGAGAVLAGAIFGDHCSPISDTTILSSMGTSCDHIEHTKTQMVYAVSIALVSVVFGYIPIGLGMNIFMVLPISIIAIYGLLRIVGSRIDDVSKEELNNIQNEYKKAV